MGSFTLIQTLLLMGILECLICDASISVCITHKSLANAYMNSELRPGAQDYVPLDQVTPKKASRSSPECASSQSSRYSRKTVRISSTDLPRPILGTKTPLPRAILGRKEYLPVESHNDRYSWRESRFFFKNVQLVKMNGDKSTPMKANGCSL